MKNYSDSSIDFRNKDQLYRISISYIVITLSIIISSYVYFNTKVDSFRLMFILPIFYSLCFVLILNNMLKHKKRMFNYVFLLLGFLRYVALPFGIVLSDRYTGRSPRQPSNSSFYLAFILMVFELIVVSIYIYYEENREDKISIIQDEVIKKFDYNGNRAVYYLFIILTIVIVLFYPRTIKYFNFLVPRETSIVNFSNISTLEHISVIFVSVSKQLVFLLILIKAKMNYDKYNSSRWILISLIAMLFNISIYSGMNRSDFILLGISSLYIFVYVFPKFKKLVLLIFILLLLIVLPAMANARQVAFLNSEQGIIYDLTHLMWGYLGGPYNVAIAIEAAEMFGEGRHFFNLIYDFLRPTLGFNIIVKDLPLNYSNQFFNYRMYLDDRVIQIMPMVGEGFFYFGFFGSPLLTLVFVKLAYFLSRVQEKSCRIEVIYFLAITTTRLGFLMGQNASIQMNDLSFNLFVPLILIWLNSKFTLRSKVNSNR